MSLRVRVEQGGAQVPHIVAELHLFEPLQMVLRSLAGTLASTPASNATQAPRSVSMSGDALPSPMVDRNDLHKADRLTMVSHSCGSVPYRLLQIGTPARAVGRGGREFSAQFAALRFGRRP